MRSCRRTSRARCSIRPIRCRSARWSGRRRSWKSAISRTRSSSRRSSASRSIAAEFEARFGRKSGGLVRGYRCEDAETIVVALGSVIGTLKETVDALRDDGVRIGVLGIQSFRPFPLAAVRAALQGARRVVVLEKSFCVGLGGVVSTDVRVALSGLQLHGYTVVAGLGGRAITKASLERMLREAIADQLRAAHLPRSRLAHRQPPARARGADAPQRPDRREPVARRRRRSPRRSPDEPTRQVLPDRHLHRRQPPARARAAHRAGIDRAQQFAQLRPSRVPGLRRGARRALRHRRGDARHRQPAHRRQRHRLPRGVLDAVSRNRRGSCRGSIRCSATPRRSAPASPPRSRSRR